MKYKLTSETKELFGKTLYRIEALKDFGDVKKGDLGGFIEKEENLSHDGNCWVFGDAKVFGNAKVYWDARVCGDALVYGDALVCEDAQVFGNAQVFGDARVYGDARVCGDAEVSGNARVYGDARVYENARVYGNAKVTKTPIMISGLPFPVQIFDNCMRIGCQLLTKDQWLAIDSEEKAKNLGDDGSMWCWRKIIRKAMKKHIKD